MFQPAVKSQARIKLAIAGPSGSGKTKGALILAKGLGAKKVAVGDSENGSASLYAKQFKFDTVKIKPPYTIEKYISIIDEAIKQKFDCLILDTISPAWDGEGGILEQKSAVDERGGNGYTNWNRFTPKQQQFMSKILNSDIDLICTMRSKQDYVLEENEKGKKVPKKVGMAPVQRNGVEYEFTTFFDLGMDHNAVVSKDRTEIFDGKIFKINEETGKQIRDWLNDSEPEPIDQSEQIDTSFDPEKIEAEPTWKELYEEIKILANLVAEAETRETIIAAALKGCDVAHETGDTTDLVAIIERVKEITGAE